MAKNHSNPSLISTQSSNLTMFELDCDSQLNISPLPALWYFHELTNMSNKYLFGSESHFPNIGSWKAGSPTSNPSWLKTYIYIYNLDKCSLVCSSLIPKLRAHRAAKFTKNKNDQWNHAGGFSISICAGLSLKMQPRNNWLNCRARCMGSEPPKCRRLHASGILRVRIWKG